SNIDTTLSGVISGGTTGKTVFINFATNSGANSLTLSNANNTFTGNMLLNRGVLQLNNDGAAGNAANKILVDTTSSGNGAGLPFGSSFTLNHNVETRDHSVFNTNGFDDTISGVITQNQSTTAYIITGSGSLTITGDNSTLTRPFTVAAGAKLILANS